MTDEAGKRYTAEDTLYVDNTPPTISMDSDSKPGIYEIDPTGYQPGQEIIGFYGTVNDSNIEVMKNNGETSVPSQKDGKPVPLDQGLNTVLGYQDSDFPTVRFDTFEKGRFHFGVTPEDLTSKLVSFFWLYPVDYARSGDPSITKQDYYFIKKGTPYLTLTHSGGVDAGPGNEDKLVVDANKPFKTTIETKNGVGMTGAKITLNDNKVYKFSNIRLTDEYKNYLSSKGVDPSKVLTVGEPYTHPVYQTGKNTDITIAGIGANGALDHDMNIIEADVTYSNPDPITGPFEFIVLKSNLTLLGEDTKVTWFPTNEPYIRQSISVLRGQLAAEAFAKTGTYTVLADTTKTVYNNTGLATGRTYYYKVRAYKIVDGVKVYGGYSTVVSAKPIPATPSSVRAASSSYNSIKTSWASVSGVNGYEVYRATSSTGVYSLAEKTTSTSFNNVGIKTNLSYYYKIRAYRIVGSTKVYSNFSTVIIAKPVPSVPVNFKATRLSSTSIKLSWSSVSGASGYEIYGSKASTGTYRLQKKYHFFTFYEKWLNYRKDILL